MSRGLITIGLLVLSNVFMTLAWYGHLKFGEMKGFQKLGLLAIIFISWGIALFEYCAQVPANRIGYQQYGGPFSLVQLKVIQEVLTLVVFVGFTLLFFKSDAVITVIEHNKQDENYAPLKHNLKQLQNMRLLNERQLTIVEIPMPDPIYYSGQRLPASYANFYISNLHVIVPTFRSKRDDEALGIIQQCFPERTVIGIDSTDLIWGLGSFHCLSQQEPAV